MLRWYCIQAKPSKAFFAKANVERLGFTTLLPSESVTKLYHGQQRSQLVPLFGSYFFTRIDIETDNWRPITNALGVRKLLSHTSDTPTPIPDHSIDTMLQCMLPAPDLPTTDNIVKPGMRARIIKGPLARDDIIGYSPTGICQWTRNNRIALLIAMIHGDVEVTFDVDSVELDTNES